MVGSHDLTARTFGVAAGLDYHVTPDTVAGFALAGGGTNWSLAQGLGGGRSDAFQAGVYARDPLGPGLSRGVARLRQSLDVDRPLRLSATISPPTSTRRASAAASRAAIASPPPFGGVTPYAAMQAQSFRTPSYSETDVTGGGFALTYNGRTATDTRSELGARFDQRRWRSTATRC